MIHLLNALEKMAAWAHMVAQGGPPVGGVYLTTGALDDLVKAREMVANELNKSEAVANAQKAEAMAAGLAHS